jgi:hypothetical protein
MASNIEYTSSEITRAYKQVRLYYIFKKSRMIEVQTNKKSFLKVFNEHIPQVEAYFKDNAINFSSDVDLKKFITWYNSLN